MRTTYGMAETTPGPNMRGHLALGLARLAHALVRLSLAAILFGGPAAIAYLLWRWLAG